MTSRGKHTQGLRPPWRKGQSGNPRGRPPAPWRGGLRKQKQAELEQARKEVANVKQAILNGLDIPITKEMLLERVEKVKALEAELKTPPSRPKVVALSTAVMKHLADLRVAFGRDNDRTRSALRKLVSQVVLRRYGDRLMAEVTGNLRALLDLDDVVENDGAGRGI